MKSIIRLLLISLSIACSQNLSAESGLSLQKAQEIKSYIAAAQALKFSDEEIKASFVKALENIDANDTVTLSLSDEYKKYVLIASGITATALVVALGVYAYNEGWFSKAVQPNQQNGQPDANAPVDQNAQQQPNPAAEQPVNQGVEQRVQQQPPAPVQDQVADRNVPAAVAPAQQPNPVVDPVVNPAPVGNAPAGNAGDAAAVPPVNAAVILEAPVANQAPEIPVIAQAPAVDPAPIIQVIVPVLPVNVPVDPVNVPVDPVNVPVDPVNVPVDPVNVPVDPVNVPVDPVFNPAPEFEPAADFDPVEPAPEIPVIAQAPAVNPVPDFDPAPVPVANRVVNPVIPSASAIQEIRESRTNAANRRKSSVSRKDRWNTPAPKGTRKNPCRTGRGAGVDMFAYGRVNVDGNGKRK